MQDMKGCCNFWTWKGDKEEMRFCSVGDPTLGEVRGMVTEITPLVECFMWGGG
jgi:hypothetical protein